MLFGLSRFARWLWAKKETEPRESAEDLRHEFRERYWNFKSLLDANHRTLEIMSYMEEALEGSRNFGMGFIRANCTAVSVNVYKIIRHMQGLSPSRYGTLDEVQCGGVPARNTRPSEKNKRRCPFGSGCTSGSAQQET